jgi:hypothetical protein
MMSDHPVSDGTTALAVQESRPSGVMTIPRSIFHMERHHLEYLKLMAQMVASSSMIGGGSINTEGDAFLVMMKGIELGMSPLYAVDAIHIIKGKPSISAKGMLAMIYRSDKLESIDIDSKPSSCVITVKRSDQPKEQVIRWDVQRAAQMGLNSGNWKTQPQTMLKWRAVSDMARSVFPDVIGGLYTTEEIAPETVVVQEDGEMSLPEPTTPAKTSPFDRNNEPTVSPFDRAAQAVAADEGSKSGSQSVPAPEDDKVGVEAINWPKFWMFTKDTLGMTEDQVHTAIGYESVKDWPGTKAELMDLLRNYAATMNKTFPMYDYKPESVQRGAVIVVGEVPMFVHDVEGTTLSVERLDPKRELSDLMKTKYLPDGDSTGVLDIAGFKTVKVHDEAVLLPDDAPVADIVAMWKATFVNGGDYQFVAKSSEEKPVA